MKKLLLSIMLVFIASGVSAGSYQLHGTSNGVSLYYKVDDYGITFKVKNNRSATVHVTVKNVSGVWSDGKSRNENVRVTYVASGKISKERYDHADNYSTMNGWSFDGWSWTE